MAKPIKLITEVKGKDAKKFIREINRANPKRDATIREARALRIDF